MHPDLPCLLHGCGWGGILRVYSDTCLVLHGSLNLGWCGMGDVGAAALGTALATNTSIEELVLTHNGITAKGASQLSGGLARSESIASLKIDQNLLIGSDGVVRRP